MAINVPAQPEQENVVANPDMGLVFFQSQGLCYNYKTDQWTRLSRMADKRIFGVQGTDRVVGTIEEGTTAGINMFQDSLSGTSAMTATATTGDFEMEPNRKMTVNGMQPIQNATANAASCNIEYRDLFSDATTSVSGTIEPRSGFYHFRGNGNPTGRWFRATIQYDSGFTTMSGAYFEVFRAGRL
jgi:hypothetical protein